MSKLDAKIKIRAGIKRLVAAARLEEKRVSVQRDDLWMILALCAAKQKAGDAVEFKEGA